MTERKRSGIKVPNIKVEGENEGNTPVRDGACAAARPATGRLFRGRGCEVAGVKPIKIYHYAKDAVNLPPLRKWCNGSRGSFVIQKELIDFLRNKLTSIDLKQQKNVKTRITAGDLLITIGNS